MTIPAGNNWCPDCDEPCHDHATMCTVCGATLVAPPPPLRTMNTSSTSASAAASVRLVPDSLSHEIRESASELRGLLQSMRSRINAVSLAQDVLLQHLVTEREEWQPVPAALLNPQQHFNNIDNNKPTAQAALAAIPRTVLTAHSAMFHTCQLEFGDGNTNTQLPSSMEAIPGEFGRHGLVVEQQRVLLHITDATLIVADPLTGQGGLSEATLQAIRVATQQQRSRVLLYMVRGGGLTFAQKAGLAQEAGASACIIGNHVTDPWPYTMRDSSSSSSMVGVGAVAAGGSSVLHWRISAVMVSKQHGQLIQQYGHNAPHCSLTIQKRGGEDNNTNNAVPDCCVCTEVFGAGDTVLKLPGCGHVFHETCALTWLTKHNTCPYCRHELPLQDDELERDRRRRGATGNTNSAAAGAAHDDFYG